MDTAKEYKVRIAIDIGKEPGAQEVWPNSCCPMQVEITTLQGSKPLLDQGPGVHSPPPHRT